MNRILNPLKPYFSAPLLALVTALTISSGLASNSYADYSTHPEVAEFINTMVEEHQFSREQIIGWLKLAKHQKSIVDAMSRPAEKVKPWYQYRKHFISEARIKNGVKFWQENRETLERAEKELGVDPAIIVKLLMPWQPWPSITTPTPINEHTANAFLPPSWKTCSCSPVNRSRTRSN